MKKIFLISIITIYLNASEAYRYSLQELAYIVSLTNKINIIISPDIKNEKSFYFTDDLDKKISFSAFVYLLKDLDYEIVFNGSFYHIKKIENDFKLGFLDNPSIPDKKLQSISKKFDLDLSLSHSSQIIAKYTNQKSFDKFNIYVQNYKPTKHVFLEGEIVAINETKLRDVGIDFTSISSQLNKTQNFDLSLFSNLNNNDAVKKILSSNTAPLGDISMFFNLLDSLGSSEIVTRPNMLIRSGESSSFTSGKQIRIVTGSVDTVGNSSDYSSKQYELLDIGLQLTCNAVVYNDIVNLDFKFNISDISTYEPELDVLIIDSKTFTSKFSVKDGEYIILAGLTTTNKTNDTYSIPILSDLPYIGNIFKHDVSSNESISYIIYFKVSIQ